MSTPHFLAGDLVASSLAFVAFPALLFAPGFGVGWALDVWGFRRQGLATRCALAVTLSVAVTPTLAFLLARALSVRLAALVLVAGAIALAIVALARSAATRARRGRQDAGSPVPGESRSAVRRAIVVAAVWTLLALLLIADVEFNGRLYPNVIAFDYAKHIAVTDAIARTGVPPINPSFHPGAPLDLYYYYYWFLLCGLVDVIGGGAVGARDAVAGGTAWAGIALMAIVALYLRLVVPQRPGREAPRVFLALALMLVTGLDIIPTAWHAFRTLAAGDMDIVASVEWWNEQVTAWPTAALWVPHHVAALVAGLTALLLLRDLARPDESRPGMRGWLVAAVAGVALASAVGMSIWVAATFALFWAVWAAVALLRRWRAEVRYAVTAGVVAMVAAIPFLLDLSRASLLHGMPVALRVREFFPLHRFLVSRDVSEPLIRLADLLALPVNYGAELGFFAIGTVLYWRWRLASRGGTRQPLTTGEVSLVVMALVALFVGSFVRSAIRSNDLGWRGMMLFQFPALLWTTDLILAIRASRAQAPSTRARVVGRLGVAALAVSAVLGVVAVAYDAALMKLYPMRRDILAALQGTRPGVDGQDGRRVHAVRAAYSWVNATLARDAIVQHNPDNRIEWFPLITRIDIYHQIYGARQVAAADPEFGTLYGIPRPMYDSVAAVIVPAFVDTTAAVNVGAAREACERFGIAALVAKSTDPVWSSSASWVWQRRPLYANEHTRVVACDGV